MKHGKMDYLGGVQGSGTGHAVAGSKGPSVKQVHKTSNMPGDYGLAPNPRKAPRWAGKSGEHKDRMVGGKHST